MLGKLEQLKQNKNSHVPARQAQQTNQGRPLSLILFESHLPQFQQSAGANLL